MTANGYTSPAVSSAWGPISSGGTATVNFSLSPSNTAPVVDTVTIAPSTAGTNDTLTASYTAHDADADTLTPAYQWFKNGTALATETGSTLNLATAGNGNRGDSITVRVTVTDGNGGSDNKTSAALVIGNTAPVVNLTGSTTTDEGTTNLYNYTVDDPDAETFTLVSKTCGANGNSPSVGAFDAATGSGSFTCVFPDGPGSSDVSVTVKDVDNASDTAKLTVDIANVAPTVTLTAAPATADEGQTKTYTYTATDPGADTLAVVEDCGANAVRVDTAAADSFDCRFPDGPASSTVRVSATDGDPAPGNSGSDQVVVAIANVAPTGDARGPYSGPWGSPGITFAGSAGDPAGTNDTLTYEWDFDYPTGGSFVADQSGVNLRSPTYQYSAPGTYTVALRVRDEDGGVDTLRAATVTIGKRTPALTYTGDDTEQYSDIQALSAELKDGSTPISGAVITFTIAGQMATATTGVAGVASTSLRIDQAPGSPSATTSFAGNAIYVPASDSDAFTVTQEDARATYTGPQFVSTASTTTSSATVALRTTIQDISALTSDPSYDPNPGDITKATVRFVDRTPNATLCTATSIVPITAGDLKTGSATCNWTASFSGDSMQFSVGIIVGGHYTRNASADNTVVTVSKPLNGFVTGGGFLVNQRSAGLWAGEKDQKTNFGFAVKNNKSNTNLQGNVNTIVRNGGRVYQIKSNTLTSLSSSTTTGKATFTGGANIQDITNSSSPVSLAGGASLQMVMTDKGEPGSADSISFTVWDKDGRLLFSSNWDGVQSVEQVLGGGNIQVR